MTSTMGDELSPADLALLQWLSRVAAVLDPEPPHLRELGRLALSVRRVDAELAALVADSDRMSAAVRLAGTNSPRVVSFEVEDVVVEVQVSDRAAGRSLLGLVEGLDLQAGDRVDLETARAEVRSAPLDVMGRFDFADVPRGLVRLRVLAGGRDVTTDWVGL